MFDAYHSEMKSNSGVSSVKQTISLKKSAIQLKPYRAHTLRNKKTIYRRDGVSYITHISHHRLSLFTLTWTADLSPP